MKSADFLVELWVEDMPVAQQDEAAQKLKEAVENLFEREKISGKFKKTFSTPRRIAVLFENVARDIEEQKTAIKGPPDKISFDPEGKPSKVLEGFLSKYSADCADIRVRETDKGNYVFLEKIVPPRSSEQVIRENIAGALEGIKFSKTMRWGAHSFPRPVRNILVMFGKKALKLDCFGIPSSKTSRAFMGENIKIESPALYEKNLKSSRILPDREKRRNFFEEQLKDALKAPLHSNPSAELTEETAGICEYPRVLTGSFDEKFLELPHEFLKVTLEFHQKCFAVYDKKGMVNQFIFVVDGVSDNAREVSDNYERCVTARFEDTKFFWENDRKKKLVEYYDDLKHVNYMGKFSTLYEKAERIIRDSGELAKIYCPNETGEVRKTAKLLYCDIVTRTVGEFPGLHGMAGQYLLWGEAEDPVRAREESSSLRDAVMLEGLNNVSAVCGLAERLNTLKSFFFAGMIPSTSKDPYGLRRAADGAVRILAETEGIDFKLPEICALVFDDVPERIKEKLYVFLKERFKLYLIREGIPADVANMTETKFDIPKEARSLSRAISEARGKQEEAFSRIAEAAKRIRNILKQAEKLKIEPAAVKKELLAEAEEKKLFDIASSLRSEIESYMNEKKYKQALMSLVTVKEPLDLFFEKIMVMDRDEALRDNRLGLLRDIDRLLSSFGKFDILNALASDGDAERMLE